jgi:hypothetical protein
MPMMGNPLTDFTRPQVKSNNMVGFVVNNVDEDDKKQRQRVQIRIPMLHRNISDEDLPWSIPDVTFNSYSNAGAGVGGVNIPPIGSKLYVRFDENDPHNPRYSGSPSTDDVSKDNELLKEDYPHTRGTVDAAGNRSSVNVEKNTKTDIHKSGTTIHIDANGTISIASAADFNLGAQGNINIVAKGDCNIDGANVNINGGAQATSTTERPRPQIPSQEGKTGA